MMRRVSRELAPFVRWALDRDGIPYKYAEIGENNDEHGYVVFQLDISSRRFTNAVEDAKSEKERRESATPEIPTLSYRAALNPARMQQLLKQYGADCFVVRAAERQKYLKVIKEI